MPLRTCQPSHEPHSSRDEPKIVAARPLHIDKTCLTGGLGAYGELSTRGERDKRTEKGVDCKDPRAASATIPYPVDPPSPYPHRVPLRTCQPSHEPHSSRDEPKIVAARPLHIDKTCLTGGLGAYGELSTRRRKLSFSCLLAAHFAAGWETNQFYLPGWEISCVSCWGKGTDNFFPSNIEKTPENALIKYISINWGIIIHFSTNWSLGAPDNFL